MPVSAIGINCSLRKSSGEPGSTDALLDAFGSADCAASPGLTSDEGEGIGWT